VTDIHGVVSAKGPQGWWIQGVTDGDETTSDAIYIYLGKNSTIANQAIVGDEISLSGVVVDYKAEIFSIPSTQIISPTNLKKISSGNQVHPIILGVDRSPPTKEFSSIDAASGGVFGVPNNVSAISSGTKSCNPPNMVLISGVAWVRSFTALHHISVSPNLISAEGQLVTLPRPVALGFDTQYSEFWAHGDYHVTGKNARGGLTMTRGKWFRILGDTSLT